MAEDETNDNPATGTPSKKKSVKVKKSPVRKKIPATRATRTTSADNAPSSLKSEPASVDRDTSNNPAPEKPVTRAGSSGQAMVSWFALVLGVVAMGVGGYAWYQGAVDSQSDAVQQETRLNLIERRIDGVEQTQTGLKTDIGTEVRELGDSFARNYEHFQDLGRQYGVLHRSDADIHAQIQGIRDEMENQGDVVSERIEKEVGALSGQIAALRTQLDSDLDGWVLEETEQLILIAHQRLRFTGETGLAKQALQLADQRLKQLSGSGVDEVRQLLSSDIAALDSVPSIDVSGLLNELSALSAQVDTLPLSGDIVMDADVDSDAGREKEDESRGTDSQGDVDETTTLDRYLKPVIDAGAALLTNLGDLVQVEKNASPVKPVISAQIRKMTYERTRLILESAQVALVRENPELFTNRIHVARKWVRQNFNVDAAGTLDWIERLNRVGSSYRDTGIPDISATLSAIRALGRSESGGQQ